MIKNLLIKFANMIIDKYGVHVLSLGSIIQIYDIKFEITSYVVSRNISNYNTLNLEAMDVLKRLDFKRI